MDSWRMLRTELQREAEQIFNSSGKVVLIECDDKSDSVLTLSLQDETLKLTYVPERNAVRWDTEMEYGFERLSEPPYQLSKTLMKRLY